ncbi:exopolyphosphatase [Nonomuraea sp. NPDC005983]|uniref:Ppx/GppA phosphatase family protein n=1 Tax=Nonomuraea sp. NPDC005983 TaxID=3155595 RepID=UPI0033B9295E
MRKAGVLDVGCHSALLTVVRGRQRRADGALQTLLSRKVRLRLHQMLTPDGRLRERGVRSVQQAVAQALGEDSDQGPQVFAFATSVIRDAPNRDEVIARVARTTGTRLRVLPGQEEARLSYVAARQWAGSTSEPLLVLDIGGGTVEIAAGTGVQPEVVHSLPLGARTVTRRWLPGGVISSKRHLKELRQHLRQALSELPRLPTAPAGGRVLACSKAFAQLAGLVAAYGKPSGRPPHSGQDLTLPQLRASIALLAETGTSRRGELPGISRHRAEQSLAGALVAEAIMDACQAARVEICPWSTREGLLLERLGITPSAERSSLSPGR